MKLFLRLTQSVLFIYLSVALFLFVFQRSFLYHPAAETDHEYDVIQYEIDDVVLDVIVLNKGKDEAIIYFGGNGEAVVANAYFFNEALSDYTVYLVNYRGYGGSTGKPTEATLYKDAQYIYDQLIAKHKKLSVIGRSLGSGVATYLASTRNINKMILVTPFDSIQAIAQKQYPVFPITLLLRDKFDSLSRVKNISAKTLVLLAENDFIIPFENSQRLIDAFPSSQIIVELLEGTGHNSISSKQEYYYFLQQFMTAL
jgi:pimeloyl-ACP methyl ester carboxylesterase